MTYCAVLPTQRKETRASRAPEAKEAAAQLPQYISVLKALDDQAESLRDRSTQMVNLLVCSEVIAAKAANWFPWY